MHGQFVDLFITICWAVVFSVKIKGFMSVLYQETTYIENDNNLCSEINVK